MKLDLLTHENILLTYLFKDKEVKEKILPHLEPQLFTVIENQIIVKEMMELYKKTGIFPKPQELFLRLDEEQQKRFSDLLFLDEEYENRQYILDEMEEFVKKKLLYHELLKGVDLLSRENDSARVNGLPDKLKEIFSLTFKSTVGLNVFSPEGREKMWNHFHSKNSVIPTGIKTIDGMLDGGLHVPSVTCFLAESGKGKSLILCALTTELIKQNYNVLYVTLELSEEYMSQRVLQNLLDMERDKFVTSSKLQFDRLYDECIERCKEKLYVKKYSQSSINCNHIRDLLKDLDTKSRFKPTVLVVDYLGIMLPFRCDPNANTNTQGQVKCQELEGLASDFKIPILTAAQTNRGGYDKTSLNAKDFADSIGIFQELDVAIGVTQTEEQKNVYPQVFSLEDLKNRFSENIHRVSVGVNKSKMRIFDLEETAQTKNPESEKAANEVINIIKKNSSKKLAEFC